MRMRRKPNLEPRIERCAHLLIPLPGNLRGNWLRAFGYGELRLEIGCGKGKFIAEMAQQNPDVLFIALEKSANVIVAALELAVQEGLQNVRYISDFAENLPEFFAPGELTQIYINFCDPWPGSRHRKRRLVSRIFLTQYMQLLRPGGEISFKTDNLPLFEFSLREFEECGYAMVETSRNLHENGFAGIMTEYETKFYNEGLPIYWCRARKQECFNTLSLSEGHL